MKAITGFVDHDTGKLLILHRGEDAILKARVSAASYATFHRKNDLGANHLQSLRRSPYVKGYSEVDDGQFIRVEWKDYESRKSAVDPEGWFAKNNIEVFEGDVHPIRRFFCDNPEIEIAEPRKAYLDIETDSRVPFSRKEEMRVLSYAIVTDDGKEIVDCLGDETDHCERLLLERLWTYLEAYDQVIAWNGDRFDFEVIKERTKRVRARHKDFRRWLFLDHLLLFKRMNLNSSDSGEEKQSLKLDDVAMILLGEGKDDFDSSKTYEAWKAGGSQRQAMLKYNLKDTLLLKKIEEKTGYIQLFQTLCDVCKCFGETRSLNPTVQMDGFMLSLGQSKAYRFPTKHYGEVQDQYAGAFVLPPTVQGIVKNVHVGDFKSLYPSIIITWNMSPETKGPKIYTGKGEKCPEGHCACPSTGATFTTAKEGILPHALKQLIKLRKVWAEKRANLPPGTKEAKEAERRSTAYKVAANSFYGVVGSPFSRYYDRDIAEGITQTGAYLIKQTMKFAETQGMQAIYGDTDSVFITGVSEDSFRRFVDRCNKEVYPAITRGCIDNTICLDCEKGFRRIVFTSAKRYAGQYAYYKNAKASEDSEPEIKGLEYKRGDIPRLARRFQKRIIDLICKDGIEDPIYFIEMIARVKEWVFTTILSLKDVQISKALSKPLDEYETKQKKDGTQTADLSHISVAKTLLARGQDVGQGTRIFYVVTDASQSPATVIPAEDYTGECDRAYLWEKLIYPPTMRFLQCAFPAKSPDFEILAKVRPSKKIKPVPPEQISLFNDPKPIRVQSSAPFEAPMKPVDFQKGDTIKVMRTPDRTYRIALDVSHISTSAEWMTDELQKKVQELSAILQKSPGKRPVEIDLKLPGDQSILALPLKVSVTPGLMLEVDAWVKSFTKPGFATETTALEVQARFDGLIRKVCNE